MSEFKERNTTSVKKSVIACSMLEVHKVFVYTEYLGDLAKLYPKRKICMEIENDENK